MLLLAKKDVHHNTIVTLMMGENVVMETVTGDDITVMPRNVHIQKYHVNSECTLSAHVRLNESQIEGLLTLNFAVSAITIPAEQGGIKFFEASAIEQDGAMSCTVE